jgi:RNA polymerase sigma factor (sigma-70 family)
MSDVRSRELFLQQHLMRRADNLKHYVAQRIPPNLAADIVPDDLLQEAWIAAFRGIAGLRIEDTAAIDHWIISIINRKLLDALRDAHTKKRGGGHMRIAERRSSSITGILGHLISRERTPSRELSDKEASRAVRVALGRLNEERRQAIRMRYIEGLAPKEIALRMGKSAPAISALLFNGLRELRERLGHAAKFFSDARSRDGNVVDQSGAEGADGTDRTEAE